MLTNVNELKHTAECSILFWFIKKASHGKIKHNKRKKIFRVSNVIIIIKRRRRTYHNYYNLLRGLNDLRFDYARARCSCYFATTSTDTSTSLQEIIIILFLLFVVVTHYYYTWVSLITTYPDWTPKYKTQA